MLPKLFARVVSTGDAPSASAILMSFPESRPTSKTVEEVVKEDTSKVEGESSMAAMMGI